MRLRNTNPLGRVDLPLIGRALEPDEEFEVDDDAATRLLEQTGNYVLADGETHDHDPDVEPDEQEDDQ